MSTTLGREGQGHARVDHRAREEGNPGDPVLLGVRPSGPYEALCLNRDTERLVERGVGKIPAGYLKAVGIAKKISPHSLPHTCSSDKAERGVSPVGNTPRRLGGAAG